MAVIPAEDYATEVNIMDNNDKVTTTLGLQWKRNEDAFIIPATPVPSDYPITESNVLKKVATVFDPLGRDWSVPSSYKQKLCSKNSAVEVTNGKRKLKMKWLTAYRTGFHSCHV